MSPSETLRFGKTIGLACALLSGAADERAAAPGFVIDHGALSHWRRGPGGWELVIHNDRWHLTTPAPPRSTAPAST